MPALSVLQDMVYAYLGTTSSNQLYTPARVTRWINDAYNALVDDMPGAMVTKEATLAADSSTSRVYTLSSQTPVITDWRQFREVRLTDSEGALLRPLPYDQLRDWTGDRYAVRDPDETVKLVLSSTLTAGSAVWVLYSYWPAELSAASDVPSTVPSRYHDLIALSAAEMAFPAGNEATFPAVYAAKKVDRYAQFLDHVTRRGTDAMPIRHIAA